MWLSDSYDVPQALIDDPPSPAFRQFLLDWFGSARRVEFNERLSAAGKLTLEETTIARQLIRPNRSASVSMANCQTVCADGPQ
jgi:hypothetical protein